MIETLFWKPFAWFVSRKSIASWIIKRAMKTPYYHLQGYMDRWWVFNGYSAASADIDTDDRKYQWLPSIRIHHILRADKGRHPHDHPWNARTVILKGWYDEQRVVDTFTIGETDPMWAVLCKSHLREKGETTTLKFGEYHHISKVSEGGVWTLFLCGPKLGKWGFLKDGEKVLHTDYDGVP